MALMPWPWAEYLPSGGGGGSPCLATCCRDAAAFLGASLQVCLPLHCTANDVTAAPAAAAGAMATTYYPQANDAVDEYPSYVQYPAQQQPGAYEQHPAQPQQPGV